MQNTKIEECTQCGMGVKLNGIGSSRSPGQRILTGIMGLILPLTCKRFRPASDVHDMEVHKGPEVGREFGVWVDEVDDAFYDMCKAEASKASNWFSKAYYMKQAKNLREALLINNGDGYPTKQCNH